MRLASIAASISLAASLFLAVTAQAAEPGDTLVLELESGNVEIALRPDLAPQHVERIKQLAREGAYDNVAFHRVIDGFMAQTGDVEFGDMEEGYDPQRAGTGGSEHPDLPAEFSDASFERGTVGMARSQNPDSANSQFFIMFAPASHLDGSYTVVGKVENGMEHVDEIKKGDPANNGSVDDPDRIIRAYIAADE
ncbi:peptidylprolyl isomerase [Chelativorans sp. YIM 93263]|uniref:peptidylprolyl isomerase n=1 Tax=Chelativorans sp. YIM 93263 TaxID=2906648 RepID=UPI0023795B14|nr:peptidylprolyl isomerase [Chelativorans sp. YIM 93263]